MTPISNIEIGDEVWAADPETGEAGNRTVTAVWPHQDWLLEFTVDGGSITTTEDHHFWNATDHEWQETQHIAPGDHLLTAEGHLVEAGDLDWDTLHDADAYDLTIEGLHTYFVDFGGGSVLVHNTDCSFDELGGLVSYYDRSDLIDEILDHTSGLAGRPTRSQIDDALSTTGTRIRDGIPGRDNSVEFVNDGVVVIVNEDQPWLSTAFFD